MIDILNSSLKNFAITCGILQKLDLTDLIKSKEESIDVRKYLLNDYLFFINRINDYNENLTNDQFNFLCKYLDIVDNKGLYQLQQRFMKQLDSKGNVAGLKLCCIIDKNFNANCVDFYFNTLSIIATYYFKYCQVLTNEVYDSLIKLFTFMLNAAMKLSGRIIEYTAYDLIKK